MSAHELAVEAIRSIVWEARIQGDPEWEYLRNEDSDKFVDRILAALARSEAVQEALVEAIWQRWEVDLFDWDLEGGESNAQAKALAADAIRAALAPPGGQVTTGEPVR